MSMRATPTDGLLYSSLAFDPDLAPLVDLFVEDLPDRAEILLDRMQASDYEGLRRLAHQMSGAAGSYGFQDITIEAAALEQMLVQHASEQDVAAAVNSLIDVLRRARGAHGFDRGDSAH
ncbi:MAG TPA: Hpt domain-containing protein [Pirellulales bacterium]|jgi:HPt (histidine-containing phosphotransfer) domain-containing protein